ncbi:MAG: SIS domain-containing protein [Planctomycetes bacterium]|jgi:glucose/mannose-6-phosphate isomerase|nr:SIS domain-containing protein [Planctomycetota bacterium]
MILDNQNQLKKFDQNQVEESIGLLGQQIAQVITENKKASFPAEYKKCKKVVFNGMGGSHLGIGLIKSLFADILKVPIDIISGYNVPAQVDKETLYVISSYSGNTEEPLSTFSEAKKRGAKIVFITANHEKNDLLTLAKKHQLPGIIFNTNLNPSQQPRLGLGYAIFGAITLFQKLGMIKITETEIKKLIDFLNNNNRLFVSKLPMIKNVAKKIALSMRDKQIVLVGAEFLVGNLEIFRNQTCENSKTLAQYLILPDANHYALEGLSHPQSNKKELIFIFIHSNLYHPRIQKRMALTEAIIKKNKIKSLSINLSRPNKLEQAFELLQISSWTTFYLSILNQVNPATIKWVDWFKKQLA